MFQSYIEGVFRRLLAKTTETHKFFGQITSDFGAFYLCARQKFTRYTLNGKFVFVVAAFVLDIAMRRADVDCVMKKE